MKARRENLLMPARLAFLGIVVAAIGGTAYGQRRPAVYVSAETEVQTDRVTLGQISQIAGEQSVTTRLGVISLGYAPAVGMSRQIDRAQIALALSAAGFDRTGVTLDAPPRVLIRRTGQSVTPDQLRAAADAKIFAQLKTAGLEGAIDRFDTTGPIAVPSGKLEIVASIAGVQNLFERFPMSFDIRIDDKIIRRVSATVEVAAYTNVFVATSDLAANKKLSAADLRLERRRIDRSPVRYIREPSLLVSKQLIQPAPKGVPITTDMLAAAVVIKYGDPVRIDAVTGRMRIVVAGEARGSGRIGDRIAVRNTQSGALMQAVITDEGRVRILL